MQAKYSVYPSVGQAVEILHRTQVNGTGAVTLKRSGREERTIKQVFICDDGVLTIKDSAGEVWPVKPGRLNTWETYIPEQAA